LEFPDVAGPLGADKLKALTDPANYLGAAQAMIDRVLGGR
jgi:adenylosuccinate lyase